MWERPPLDAAEAARVAAAIAAGAPMESLATEGLPRLVPFAKAYSGLTDAEIRQVDALIRRTTIEKFGPVRSVVPQLVVELGFEGIQASSRHKSGIAVRFPRILHLRSDNAERPFLFDVGDDVRFRRIDRTTYDAEAAANPSSNS